MMKTTTTTTNVSPSSEGHIVVDLRHVHRRGRSPVTVTQPIAPMDQPTATVPPAGQPVALADGAKIRLKLVKGCFLGVQEDGSVVTSMAKKDAGAVFVVRHRKDGYISLVSPIAKFVRILKDGSIDARGGGGRWTLLNMSSNKGNRVSFKSVAIAERDCYLGESEDFPMPCFRVFLEDDLEKKAKENKEKKEEGASAKKSTPTPLPVVPVEADTRGKLTKEERLALREQRVAAKEARLAEKQEKKEEKAAAKKSAASPLPAAQENVAAKLTKEERIALREARLAAKEARFAEKEARMAAKAKQKEEKAAAKKSALVSGDEANNRAKLTKEERLALREQRIAAKEARFAEKEARMAAKAKEREEKQKQALNKRLVCDLPPAATPAAHENAAAKLTKEERIALREARHAMKHHRSDVPVAGAAGGRPRFGPPPHAHAHPAHAGRRGPPPHVLEKLAAKELRLQAKKERLVVKEGKLQKKRERSLSEFSSLDNSPVTFSGGHIKCFKAKHGEGTVLVIKIRN